MFSKKLLFSIVGLYLPFAKEHASKKVCEVTVDMMYGGMRGIKAFVTETPLLDPEEGIRFRDYTIKGCQKLLPKAPNGENHCLRHFNVTEVSFYTVLFGVFRSLDVCASLVRDRAVGFPVERPKSMSTEGLRALFEANKEDDFSDDIFMAGQKQYSDTYRKTFAMSTSEQSSSELPNRSDELQSSWIHALQYGTTLGSEVYSYRGLAEEVLAS
ncbi:hypothetical protein Aperf_G00000111137 [Anoplocephala perfoliata]